MTEKLKPCPFCGGEKVYVNKRQAHEVEIECLSCPAKIEAIGILREKDAIKAWNRRAK